MILQRTNTILYCSRWAETVAFYSDVFDFHITHQTAWFVEFQLTSSAFLSIADAKRTSIESVAGQGITLSWQTVNIYTARDALQKVGQKVGIEVTEIKKKWGAYLFYLHDPEGHRIELWQTVPE